VATARGYTLFEVVIGFGLIAICLPLFFNLVPLSLKALRDSERLRMCSSIAQRYLEEAYFLPLTAGLDVSTSLEVQGEKYAVVREIYHVDAARRDVVVQVWAERQPDKPYRLAGRLAKRTP